MSTQVDRDQRDDGQEIVFEMTLKQAVDSIVARTFQDLEDLEDTLTLPAPGPVQMH